MNPGRLDRRIVIESNASTLGATGQSLNGWSTLATVWANKRDVSGTETNRGGEEVARGSTVFTIRFRSDVGPKERITYSGSTYDINFTEEMGRTEYLKIHTERRTDG